MQQDKIVRKANMFDLNDEDELQDNNAMLIS